MRKPFFAALLSGWLFCAAALRGQQVCPGLPYVADTPEDELMQAVNGAENPQEQVAALDKYAQAHGDSKFMPCAEEYYTIVYSKLNDFADRKSTRLNSSHANISYAVFCLKKKKKN